ncbi:MAG: hypothetical protein C0490_20110 [Marivirga sp.]|nr:hypothetical protein [Marivirga sp.]
MKTKRAGQSNLIEGGRDRLENTNEFRSKVEEIKKDVRDKYSLTLLNERNWTKRLLIFIRREIEIRRRVAELSSLKNLHLGHRCQM